MAIDTAAKRRSAIATRRLPWMRRFQAAPDGSMDLADRQQLALAYRGILVGGPSFTPNNLSPTLHVTADERIYQDVANTIAANAEDDPVASWVDLFGGTNALQQATVNRRPTLALNELDGHPAVRFDDSYLRITTDIVAAEVWLVLKWITPSDVATLVSDADAAGKNIRLENVSNPITYRGNSNTNSDDFTHGGGTLFVNGIATNRFPSDHYHILRVRAAAPTSAFTLELGTDFGGTEADLDRAANVLIAWGLVVPTLLTAGNVTDLTGYLEDRYPSLAVAPVPSHTDIDWTFSGSKRLHYTFRVGTQRMSTATQIPEVNADTTRNAAVDFTQYLESGELLGGTPVVTQVSKTTGASDLTISGATLNPAVIEVAGSDVAINSAVQFTVVADEDAFGTYKLKIVVETDDGQEIPVFVKLKVKAA